MENYYIECFSIIKNECRYFEFEDIDAKYSFSLKESFTKISFLKTDNLETLN